MPVVSMIRRTRSRIGSPIAGAQPAQLVGQQREPLARLGASRRGRPGRRARRTSDGISVGSAPSTAACELGLRRRRSRAAAPGRRRARGPADRAAPGRAGRSPSADRSSSVSSAALAVTSWSRVSVATTSATSGSRSRPLRPTISTGISRSVSASKTAAAWALSRVRTPISLQRRRSADRGVRLDAPGRRARRARRRRSRARSRAPRPARRPASARAAGARGRRRRAAGQVVGGVEDPRVGAPVDRERVRRRRAPSAAGKSSANSRMLETEAPRQP